MGEVKLTGSDPAIGPNGCGTASLKQNFSDGFSTFLHSTSHWQSASKLIVKSCRRKRIVTMQEVQETQYKNKRRQDSKIRTVRPMRSSWT